MSFSFENSNYYTLFPCDQQTVQSVSCLNSQTKQPLANSINIIQRPSKAVNQNSKKLFVGNLPASTTLAELVNLFGKFGKINLNMSVVKEDNYAFIHFYSELDAQTACQELNNSLYKNRYIRVQYSTSLGHVNKSKSTEQTNKKIYKSQSTFSFNEYSSSASSSENSNDYKPIGRPIRGTKHCANNGSISSSTVTDQLNESNLCFNLSNFQSIDQYLYVQNFVQQQALLKRKIEQQYQMDQFHFQNSSSNLD